MNNDCSILLLTCDNYVDVAQQNIRLIEKFWNNRPFGIFVGTEKKGFDCEGEGINILYSNESQWSKRVRQYLEVIPTEYVLVMLDDFFVEQEVDNDRIISILEQMKINKNIASTLLIPTKKKKGKIINGLLERKRNQRYLMTWQIGIWKKEDLLFLMRDNENPWESEIFGSLRARFLSQKNFCCLPQNTSLPIKYGKGWLIVRGVWNEIEINRLKNERNIIVESKGRPIQKVTRTMAIWTKMLIQIRRVIYTIKLLFSKLLRKSFKG
ncbi:MAG: hypothetical protein IJX88_01810 [Clostridia bacterium]|nr:hypothetical protein [Clostridia bacterium]